MILVRAGPKGLSIGELGKRFSVTGSTLIHHMKLLVTVRWVQQILGGDGVGTVFLAALLGVPAYLNGYAAVGLLGGLMDQGMAPGAAMVGALVAGLIWGAIA